MSYVFNAIVRMNHHRLLRLSEKCMIRKLLDREAKQ